MEELLRGECEVPEDIIIISSTSDEDEFKSVSHVEHRCDDYKSAPTRKKQKRLSRKKRRRVPDDESTSSSDSELHNQSSMKWMPAVNMKSDMSHHSLIPKQNDRVGKLRGGIPPRHHLQSEKCLNMSSHHHHSTPRFKNTREGYHKRNKIFKKTFQESKREPCHLPDNYNCEQFNARKHETQGNRERGQVDSFFEEKLKQADISCHQSTTETILISSGASDSELNCSADSLRSVSDLVKASLPPSPQSEFEEELTDHELGKILDDARAVNESVDRLDEMERYSPPVSPPSSIKSPIDNGCVVQRQDIFSSEVCHLTMKRTTENVFPKEERGDVKGNLGLNQNFSFVCKQPVKSPEETFPASNSMDQETSDFEDVLSKSTLIALSQKIVSSSDEPDESDDELPEIDCFSAEVSETLSGNVEGKGPPLLGRYGQSPTPNDVEELHKQIRHLSDIEDASSVSSKADYDDNEDVGSISESAMNTRDGREKTATVVRKIPPPNHIWGKGKRQVQGEDEVRPALFTSYIMNLVEACHDEEFVSASISLTQSFTTTRSIPPADTIHFLLQSVLLDMSVSWNNALHAYKVLRHIHTLHPLSERTFDIEWEFLKNVVTSVVEAATSSGFSNEWTSQERAMLALKFMLSVFESEVFLEEESFDHHKTLVLERYMVRDVLKWLDVCMTSFDTWSSFVHQQFVQELITQLQKLLHFCCLPRFGDHQDFVARNLVYNLNHLSLPQKRHFLQTITCHELRQQLVELYLETNFEIPCCSLCKSNSTKVASTRQLSLQKLCNYHVHQRPLQVTQSVSCDDVLYYADEETGERVIIKPIPQDSSVRRHCTSCSRRIRLKPEHCEELVLLLLCLLQSLIQCPYPRVSGLIQTVSCQYSGGKTLREDDQAVLSKLEEHVNILTEDLLLSCSKLTVRTRLYLKEMSCLQRRL